ncbi:MAG TPA: MBL fold metallo-hydrolase [Solirubrobacteraceae bacterium]|nr:MBL fold metallo-hydrolase [Solirubrobacteraceae bacterium]
MGQAPLLTYVGGPTALIEWRGLRLLTDPTLDPAGSVYELPAYTLRKRQGPALGAAEIGHIDTVLLSHDHHVDNLDHAGRALLAGAGRVICTQEGSARLQGGAVGLAPWQSTSIKSAAGSPLTITATPARHGPEGGDRGPVIGFLCAYEDSPQETIYFSGDTVLFAGVEEVARRHRVRWALLNAGAARVAAAGTGHLTFTAEEAATVARMLAQALIVPLHYEGWEHFSESREDLERGFAQAGVAERVLWAPAGRRVELPL